MGKKKQIRCPECGGEMRSDHLEDHLMSNDPLNGPNASYLRILDIEFVSFYPYLLFI